MPYMVEFNPRIINKIINESKLQAFIVTGITTRNVYSISSMISKKDDQAYIWIPLYTKMTHTPDKRKKLKVCFVYPNYSILFLQNYDYSIEHDIQPWFSKLKFLNPFGTPTPLSLEELQNIVESVKELKYEITNPTINLQIGTRARIIEGHFTDFIGTVVQICDRKITLEVPILGQATKVVAEIYQLEKEI